MTKIGQQIESYDVSVEQTKPADVRKGFFFLFFFFYFNSCWNCFHSKTQIA